MNQHPFLKTSFQQGRTKLGNSKPHAYLYTSSTGVFSSVFTFQKNDVMTHSQKPKSKKCIPKNSFFL